MHERYHEQAAVALAAQFGDLGCVGVGVVDVHDRGGLLVEHAAREREVAQAVGARVGQTAPGVVVLGQSNDSVGVAIEFRDGTEVTVEQARHAHRDLEQQLGEVEPAGESDGGVYEHVDLAFASKLRGEVVAPADGAREVVDVTFVDAAVAARGT